jgi:hypothetical protein
MARLALSFVCLVSIVACGQARSDPGERAGAASHPAGDDVCSLLTADDIRSVTGVAPGEPRFESPQCIWSSADGSNEFLVQLLTSRSLLRSYDDLVRQYKEQMQTDAATVVHPIEGAGDFAVGFTEMPMVQIYSGSTLVQVATFSHQESHALELARRALARLH